MGKAGLRDVFSPKMLIILVLGFASGMPLLLTGGTLKIWLAREQVDISMIGYFSWVGLSYSLKFFWAPFLDRFSLSAMGRRRSWMLVTQAAIVAGLIGMSMLDPKTGLAAMAALAVMVAFFSATYDIAFDAYRREICKDEELGLGMTMGTYGYRLAMVLTGGVGVGFVGADPFNLTWGQLYIAMAAFMGIGIVTTLLAPEPTVAPGSPRTLREAIVHPVKEFMARDQALLLLVFVFLFKIGDTLAAAMLTPLYVETGFSNADIGFIAKTVGLISSLVGMFVGGILMLRLGIYKSLWFFGILQALSTAGFTILTFTGPQKWALALTVVFEDLSSGMGTAAFVAFIASICDRKYTATQFAVLTSIAMLGRTFFAGFTGDMVKGLGWMNFYLVCAAIAIPGLVMLSRMRKYQSAPAV